MKKSTFFLACCIGLMLFASCKKDPIAPTINIYAGEGCVTENAQVYSGDEFVVGFTATGESLAKIDITLSQNGTVLVTYTDDLNSQKDEPVAPYLCKHNFVLRTSGTVTITGTVTDYAGQTASKSFEILCNEKPCAIFLGEYQGNVLFNGTMEASVAGMDPVQQEVTDNETPVILSITEGETVDEVVVVFNVNGQESTVTGTVEGDKVIIALTDVPYSFNYQMNGFSISPTMVMNLNLTATLVDDQLMLDGTCHGDGEVNVFFATGTITIDGTIGGSLTNLGLIQQE